ncbi:SPOR domain-containing protein [Pseudomonas sp. Fl5BN2]|uniref:SPOR domain-containing protein n=1 Tax=unclassified Pseudomonas TaxID=196821 RepID=UPI001377B209|nr:MULTISPECIES: SPOR domain-containing protein [unclassified Pseudomonas]NBF06043.1 SPOR domain-containing protein [Pseudomonas sp. Fl5BN2]NBF11853.1 SPOR domain-containing protein [Pseudomonas sp. Fl4BN1]
MMMAVLALAGCGEGKRVEASKNASAAAQVQPAEVSTAPQWDVLVGSELPLAVSDLTGWLIEHGIISSVDTVDGKRRVLVGPFSSQAEAEAKRAEVAEKLVKAKKRDINATVIEHRVAQ